MAETKAIFRRQLVKSGSSYPVVIPPEIIEGMHLKLYQKIIVIPRDDGIFLKLVEEEN